MRQIMDRWIEVLERRRKEWEGGEGSQEGEEGYRHRNRIDIGEGGAMRGVRGRGDSKTYGQKYWIGRGMKCGGRKGGGGRIGT